MPKFRYKGKVPRPVEINGEVVSIRPGMVFEAKSGEVAALKARKLLTVLPSPKVVETKVVETKVDAPVEKVEKSEKKSDKKAESKVDEKSDKKEDKTEKSGDFGFKRK